MSYDSQLPSIDVLHWMLLAREGDQRESLLLRQGKGWFQLPCTGHEALAALACHLRPEDAIFPHYRDRALMEARGMGTEQLARDYFACKGSSSSGRNMPGHFSSASLNVFSIASPTGSQCLPSAGYAWGMQLEAAGVLERSNHASPKNNLDAPIVICGLGDASTRQGEFYEAVCFAVQEKLPVLFVVEDNGIGISTPTEHQLPFRLDIFNADLIQKLNGRDVYEVYEQSGRMIEQVRSGKGPAILWCEFDRLCSHTSSDDQRTYRSKEEIERIAANDPLETFARQLIESGSMTSEAWEKLQQDVKQSVDELYRRVEKEPAPGITSVLDHLYGPQRNHSVPPFQAQDLGADASGSDEITMVAALNKTFQAGLQQFPDMLMFGEDIEDPKGGVFKFTEGLSDRFPGRVVNSPLAEGTIVGLGVGLAAAGFRPVFEIQFIDFIAPAFNQLVTQVATLRWRSKGEWKCPMVIYAPYGAYLPAGGMWHSQSNDGWWAHTPGLRVAVPSTPEDIVGLFWAAFQDEDPTLILIPKHLFRMRMPVRQFEAVPFGRAAIRQEGSDVTVVSWGNCIELAEKAAEKLKAEGISIEIIDLRTLVPCDWGAIEQSLEKTGRLVVIHEDNRTCGFGQAIITEMTSKPERFDLLLSPPQLVARLDVHVPFCPDIEYAVLPDLDQVLEAIRITLE